jgi:hypothetical protein
VRPPEIRDDAPLEDAKSHEPADHRETMNALNLFQGLRADALTERLILEDPKLLSPLQTEAQCPCSEPFADPRVQPIRLVHAVGRVVHSVIAHPWECGCKCTISDAENLRHASLRRGTCA